MLFRGGVGDFVVVAAIPVVNVEMLLDTDMALLL
jgi:hypothetical protein